MSAVNRVSTFCIVIHKPMAIPICPIRTCAWKASSGFCRYSQEAEGLDAQGLAKLLNKPIPDQDTVVKIKADLLKAVRSTLIKA